MFQTKTINIYSIVFIILISTMLSSISSLQGISRDYELKALGVEGVLTRSLDSSSLYVVEQYYLSEYSVNQYRNYVQVTIDNYDGHITEPGKPELPYKFFEIKLPRKASISEVATYDIDYTVVRINSILKPFNYISFNTIYQNGINYSNSLLIDYSVYSLNKYYPGKLFDYVTESGRDYKYIYIWFYPVQYNPVKQELIIVKTAKIIVTYEYSNSIYVKNLPDELVNVSYVIITNRDLIDQATRLADFYNRSIGVKTIVVSMEWIYNNYSEAENITQYRGFYNNPFDKLWVDEYYELLKTNYNWSLALRIISFLRNLTEYSSAKYVLIFGSAKIIPPSFYYLSMTLYQRDSWNGWIPTDIFYASPNYELFPDLYVARIPVSNKLEAERVVDKIISWYSALEEDSSWFRNIVLAGGYSPGLIYFHDELVINDMVRSEVLNRLNSRILSRIDDTLSATEVLRAFSGDIGWFFLLSQGLGYAFVDVKVAEGLNDLELVLLADVYDVLFRLNYNSRVPIVLSTASMNSAWDLDILTPPDYYDLSLSIGKALLLSDAGSISYIGGSRVTLSTYTYEFKRGVIYVKDYGASLLLRKIMEAYDNTTSGKTTLGEIFWRGIRDYLASVTLGDFSLSTIMEFTPFLGDPCLTIPVFDRTDKSIITTLYLIGEDYVDANSLFGKTYGTIPLVPQVRRFVNFSVRLKGVIPPEISVQIYRLYGWRIDREDLSRVRYLGEYRFNVSRVGKIGNSYGYIELSETVTGIILVRIKTPDHDVRLYVLSYGMSIIPKDVYAGSVVAINAYGLDVFYPPGTQATVSFAGVFMGYAVVNEYGYVNAPVLIPIVEPGIYVIKISFPRYYYYNTEVFPVEHMFTVNVLMSKTLSEIINNIVNLNKTLINVLANASSILEFLRKLNESNIRIIDLIEKQLLNELRNLREGSELIIINSTKQLRELAEAYINKLNNIESSTKSIYTVTLANTVLSILVLILIILVFIKRVK